MTEGNSSENSSSALTAAAAFMSEAKILTEFEHYRVKGVQWENSCAPFFGFSVLGEGPFIVFDFAVIHRA